MLSIFNNYEASQELWDQAVTKVRDMEVIAHLRGVAAQMHTLIEFFWVKHCFVIQIT